MRSPFGFPRTLRLVREGDFQRTYRVGRRARGRLLVVVGAPNGLDHPRLGLSVGKRIWKKANRRNRVRRIFREAFRLERPELPQDLDLILIPAQPKLDPGLRETRRELVRLAHKVRRRLIEAGTLAAGAPVAVAGPSGGSPDGPRSGPAAGPPAGPPPGPGSAGDAPQT